MKSFNYKRINFKSSSLELSEDPIIAPPATVIAPAKSIHFFSRTLKTDGPFSKNLLGGKGSGLLEMSSSGINVPSGFVIDTSVSKFYSTSSGSLPSDFKATLQEAILELQKLASKRLVVNQFDDPTNFLLVSVRSGAPISMPGMMDTILNVGLTPYNQRRIREALGKDRFVLNCYLRLLESLITTVWELNHNTLSFNGIGFHSHLDKLLRSNNRSSIPIIELEQAAHTLEEFLISHDKSPVLNNPELQILESVGAVLRSYNSPRAKVYRELYKIDENLGTAVAIQEMVFGNYNNQSCTGVVFSRNPSNGQDELFGEFVVNGQGEDVVSGIVTPTPINGPAQNTFERLFPHNYQELKAISKRLESHNKDMQDIEFTVENRQLFILQSRSGKRSAEAALKILVDLVNTGAISKKEAIKRTDPNWIENILHPVFVKSSDVKSIAKGLGSSPGAAVGKIALTASRAFEMSKSNEKIILVRNDTSPEDILGMKVSKGILTSRGGMTSHAAVVARGMGLPCVCGAASIKIFEESGYIEIPNGSEKIQFKEGDIISINGETGEVFGSEIELRSPDFSGSFQEIMRWSDEFRTLGVRANADNAEDAKLALDFGAMGIGLCRTEHMFFAEDRILSIRKMIFAESNQDRDAILEDIKRFQKADFLEIFRSTLGKPVTVRLLDPPLHEFLPFEPLAIEKFACDAELNINFVKEKIKQLTEKNPMLGHRGSRLGITFPNIYKIQVEALFEAACELLIEIPQARILPEIMIPIIAWEKECEIMVDLVKNTARKILEANNIEVPYLVGAMLELPRAALFAGRLAKFVDFFSFGTNDLTQTTLGISRDDIGGFLNSYIDNGIFSKSDDPFVNLDEGVIELMTIGTERARAAKPSIKIGICGEHGGSPASVRVCHKLGLNYVSASAFRVPIARLSAAQAAIEELDEDLTDL